MRAELAWEGRSCNPQPDTTPLPMEDSGRANASRPILQPESTHFLEHSRNWQPPSGFQGQMMLIHPFLWRAASLTLASSWVCSLLMSKQQVWYLRCTYGDQLCVISLLLPALQMVCFPASRGAATLGEGVMDRGIKISRVKVQKRQTEKQGGRQSAKGAKQTAPCPGAAVGTASAKEGARQSCPRYKQVNTGNHQCNGAVLTSSLHVQTTSPSCLFLLYTLGYIL